MNELEALDRALKQLYTIRPGVHELKRLDAIRAYAATCQKPLEEFLDKIQKFNKSLGTWNAGRHRVHALGRGLQWSFAWKDEVKSLRSKLTSKVSTILLLLTTQTVESLVKAETDRANVAQDTVARLSLQQALLERWENDRTTGHAHILRKLHSHTQEFASLQSKSDKVVNQGSDIQDHLQDQDAALHDLQQHVASSSDQTKALCKDVTIIQHDVAAIRADTTSILAFMIKLMAVFTERVSKLQHVAELISDLLKLTTTLSGDMLQAMAVLLREFWEIRKQLARIERYLPMRIDYPMVQFRDAMNNVTPFPYHVFRQWEGARRMVAAIFVNRQGLRRVEMGHWFVTHVRRGTRLEPKFWDKAIAPGDELAMTMIFDRVSATEGFCPFPSCGADTSNEEMVRGGKFCPRCYRYAELSHPQFQASSTEQQPSTGGRDDGGHDHPQTNSLAPIAAQPPGDRPRGVFPELPPVPMPGLPDNEDIEEYFSVQVARTQAKQDGLEAETGVTIDNETDQPTQQIRRPEDYAGSNIAVDNSYFEIAVQLPTGPTMKLRVSITDRIEQIRARISELKPHLSSGRLTYAGKQLEDRHTLFESGVRQSTETPLIVATTRQELGPKDRQPARLAPIRATPGDARRAGIPAGYALKLWDPRYTPIIFLGSVFDHLSLGKWILDWALYCHRGPSPPVELADELAKLLDKVGGFMWRARTWSLYIKSETDRDVVESSLRMGQNLMKRFKNILKVCQEVILENAKARQKTTSTKGMVLGTAAGRDFVDTMFGKDAELGNTKYMMAQFNLWAMGFETNCFEILQKAESDIDSDVDYLDYQQHAGSEDDVVLESESEDLEDDDGWESDGREDLESIDGDNDADSHRL